MVVIVGVNDGVKVGLMRGLMILVREGVDEG